MKGSVNEHQLTPDASVKHVYIYLYVQFCRV